MNDDEIHKKWECIFLVLKSNPDLFLSLSDKVTLVNNALKSIEKLKAELERARSTEHNLKIAIKEIQKNFFF